MSKTRYTLHLIFTLILTVQLAFGETIIRRPNSTDHKYSVDALLEQIKKFKESIKGKELPNTCEEDSQKKEDSTAKVDYENYDDYIKSEDEFFYSKSQEQKLVQMALDSIADPAQEYTKQLENFEKNACGVVRYKLQDNDEKSCVSRNKKVKGIIDEITDFAVLVESEERQLDDFEYLDKKIKESFSNADILKKNIELFVNDEEFDKDLRATLLGYYVDGVVMPLRDVAIIATGLKKDPSQGYRHLIDKYLIVFSDQLFEDPSSMIAQMIIVGLNAAVEQNYMRYADLGDGRARFEFDPMKIINRDVVSLMRAPTQINYMIALKWLTLHMMTTQIFYYNKMLGEDGNVEIPPVCQNHFNTNLPKSISYKLKGDALESPVLNMLGQYGLIQSGSNRYYTDYYLNNIDKNPLEDYYNGLAPFEELKSAQVALNKGGLGHSVTPELDDYAHFQQIMNIKLRDIYKIYYKSDVVYKGRGDIGRKDYQIEGLEEIKKLFTRVEEGTIAPIKLGSGDSDIYNLAADRLNLSEYLLERMQRQGIVDQFSLMSIEMIKRLKANVVKLDFPSLYGSNSWMNWALIQLRDVLENYKDASVKAPIFKQVASACKNLEVDSNNTSYYGVGKFSNKINTSVCGEKIGKGTIKHVRDYVDRLIEKDDFVSIRRRNLDTLQKDWPILARIWKNLRDKTDLFDIATVDEYKFLKMQMQSKSSWAMVRLGYLVALEEMESQKKGFTPTYLKNTRGQHLDDNSRCFYDNIDFRIEMLKRVGHILKVDEPLNLGHSNKILTPSERKSVWEEVYSSYDQKSMHLFTEELGPKKVFEHLEDVSYESLFASENRDRLLNEMSFLDRSKIDSEIDKVLNSREGQDFKKLMSIYRMKGDVNSQISSYQDYARMYGIQTNREAKLNFLAIDSEIKYPIMREVILEGARKRKESLEERLNDFCALDPKDHQQMQAIYHETTVNHTKLNEQLGLSNDKILEFQGEVNSMAPDEWTDLKQSLGAVGIAIGLGLVGGPCMMITGGLCSAPIVAAGAWAISLQMEVFKRERLRKSKADALEIDAGKMEKLGFAKEGSADAVARSAVWTYIEGVSIFPLIGSVAKSVEVGGKIAFSSLKGFAKELGKLGDRDLKGVWKSMGEQGSRAWTDYDVNYAKYVTRERTLGTDFKDVGSVAYVSIRKTFEEIQKTKSLFLQGEISLKQALEMVLTLGGKIQKGIQAIEKVKYPAGKLAVETISKTNKRTAKRFVQYWGPDLRSYYSHLRGMWGNWSLSSKWRGNRLKYAEYVMKKVENGEYNRFMTWLMKLRHERVARVAPQMRRVRRALRDFVNNGEVVVDNVVIKTADDFALHFIEDLTDIHVKAGLRLGEAPYFLVQGVPHMGGIAGKKIPRVLLGASGDSQMMRQLFLARGRLYEEGLEKFIDTSIGLPQHVKSRAAYSLYEWFQESVEAAVAKSPDEAKAAIIQKQYDDYQAHLAKIIEYNLKGNRVPAKFVSLIEMLAKETGSRVRAFQAFPSIFTETTIDEALVSLGRDGLMNYVTFDAPMILRLLTNTNKTASEKVLTQYLFSSVDVEKIFEYKNIEGMSYEVARALANYQTVGEFQHFLNAMKILSIKREKANIMLF